MQTPRTRTAFLAAALAALLMVGCFALVRTSLTDDHAAVSAAAPTKPYPPASASARQKVVPLSGTPSPPMPGPSAGRASVTLSRNTLRVNETVTATGRGFPAGAVLSLRIMPVFDNAWASLSSGITVNDAVRVEPDGRFTVDFSLTDAQLYQALGSGPAVVHVSASRRMASTPVVHVPIATAPLDLVVDEKSHTAAPESAPLLVISEVDVEHDAPLSITAIGYPPNTSVAVQYWSGNDPPPWNSAKTLGTYTTDAFGSFATQLTAIHDDIESPHSTSKGWLRVTTADGRVEHVLNIWVQGEFS